jgi:molecular chaperone DnaJ
VRSGMAGDLFCHVVVETPVRLTERQKEMLREFESSMTEGGAKHSPQSKSWKDKVKEFFE